MVACLWFGTRSNMKMDTLYKCMKCGRQKREVDTVSQLPPACHCGGFMDIEHWSPEGCLQVWDERSYGKKEVMTRMGSFRAGV